jgi:N6-L-threonylcarbamoyladenine synthase
MPSLHKGGHEYDVSYSGLKTAVINQIDQFWNPDFPRTNENLAAAFQETAVNILVSRLLKATRDTGITTVVAGGGVAANSRLRALLAEKTNLTCVFPSLSLCGDNGAMIAALGYRYLSRGQVSPLTVTANARVEGFRKKGRP